MEKNAPRSRRANNKTLLQRLNRKGHLKLISQGVGILVLAAIFVFLWSYSSQISRQNAPQSADGSNP